MVPSDDSKEQAPPSVAPAPLPKKKREMVVDVSEPSRPQTKPHHTRCKVVGSGVTASTGRLHAVGDVAEFADADVLSLPDYLIPIDE